jgi:predicted RNA-binding Zn ribbon-like protein
MVEELPGDIALLEEFTDSVDVLYETDEFDSEDGLVTWLRAHGLLTSDERATPDDLRVAIELRDALREQLLAHHDDQTDPAATERLERIAAMLPLRVTFGHDGTVGLAPAAEGVRGALARVVAAVAEADAHGRWARLKLCPADDCLVPFYDRSKNRSRRWCDMAVCGNRQKTRTYRERHRE